MKKFTLPLFLVISLWVFVPVYADMPPAAPGREVLALPKLEIVSCDSPAAVVKNGGIWVLPHFA